MSLTPTIERTKSTAFKRWFPIHRTSLRSPPRSKELRQGLWFLIGVAHVPAWVGTGRVLIAGGFPAERLGGFVGLSLAIVFFALKVRDVGWLRFRTDWRSWVALCMAVALLHLDVVRPGDDPTLVPEGTALLATTWVVGTRTPFRQVVWRVRHWLTTPRSRLATFTSRLGSAWLEAFRPCGAITMIRVIPPRAPPFRS